MSLKWCLKGEGGEFGIGNMNDFRNVGNGHRNSGNDNLKYCCRINCSNSTDGNMNF